MRTENPWWGSMRTENPWLAKMGFVGIDADRKPLASEPGMRSKKLWLARMGFVGSDADRKSLASEDAEVRQSDNKEIEIIPFVTKLSRSLPLTFTFSKRS
jgi:hypothetical protein